jgi:hypothetical protein
LTQRAESREQRAESREQGISDRPIEYTGIGINMNTGVLRDTDVSSVIEFFVDDLIFEECVEVRIEWSLRYYYCPLSRTLSTALHCASLTFSPLSQPPISPYLIHTHTQMMWNIRTNAFPPHELGIESLERLEM